MSNRYLWNIVIHWPACNIFPFWLISLLIRVIAKVIFKIFNKWSSTCIDKSGLGTGPLEELPDETINAPLLVCTRFPKPYILLVWIKEKLAQKFGVGGNIICISAESSINLWLPRWLSGRRICLLMQETGVCFLGWEDLLRRNGHPLQ